MRRRLSSIALLLFFVAVPEYAETRNVIGVVNRKKRKSI
jgi:hypothetical protein